MRRPHCSRLVHAGVGIIALLAVGSAGACDSEPPAQPTPTATATGSPIDDSEAGPEDQTGCDRTTLPTRTADPYLVAINGGDPSGRYLVGEAEDGVVVWDDAVPTFTTYGDKAALVDINTSGHAVGWFYTGNFGALRAATYVDGTWHELKGDGGRALGINEHGLIAGVIWFYTNVQWPVVWSSPTAEPHQLPLPAGSHEGMVAEIGDDGTVAGSAVIPGVGVRPVLWRPDGTLRELTGLLPDTGPDGEALFDVYPQDMRGDWMLLNASFPEGRSAYFVLNLATEAIRWLPAGFAAAAVNVHGWVVGGGPQGAARIDSEGTIMSLPGTNGGVDVATISDDGRTVGGYLSEAPFLWRCA